VVVLANAYVDLGTWWCMTPFIAPASASAVSIANFTDQASLSRADRFLPALAFATTCRNGTCLALHAGVAYKSPELHV